MYGYKNRGSKLPNTSFLQDSNNSRHYYEYPPQQQSNSTRGNYVQSTSQYFRPSYPFEQQVSGHLFPSQPQFQPQQTKRNVVPKNKKPKPQQHYQQRPDPHGLKHYSCPICSKPYEFFLLTNPNYLCEQENRLPLILNCRHTVCHLCIRRRATEKFINCPKCKKRIEFPENILGDLENLQSVFPINFFIIGAIAWARHKKNDAQVLSLVPTQVTLNKKLVARGKEKTESEGKEKCCFLRCTKEAILQCKDCNDIYCADCFATVHGSARSLSLHVQVPLVKKQFSSELEKCPEHPAMQMEFFCVSCKQGACCYCFLEKHEGHDRESLSKLSEEELEKLQFYKEKAIKVLKLLILSQKRLRETVEARLSDIEGQVYSYFADLHGQLVWIERKLTKYLSNLQAPLGEGNVFRTIGSELDSAIRKWSHLISTVEDLSLKNLNLRGIYEEFKEVESVPCHLTGLTTDLNFDFFSDPILYDLEELFNIHVPENSLLRLEPLSEMSPNCSLDSLDSQMESDLNTSISSLVSKKTKPRKQKVISVENVDSERSSKKGKGKPVLDKENVDVTHIESLECFYVQLKKNQSSFIQMNKDIENYINLGARNVKDPKLNELYLVKKTTSTETMWCRGRLTEFKTQEGVTLYEVYFIDFGSSQWVDITKLREITPQLAQRKPFAIQCELYNPSNVSWTSKAHVYLGKIISGKDVYMLVKQINDGVYIVHLMVLTSDTGHASVIDLLINTFPNVLCSSCDEDKVPVKSDLFVPTLKIYSNSYKFHKNQAEKVVLANIVNPHRIFVQVAEYVDLLKSMVAKMREFYTYESSENCIPIQGSYAVVEYKDPIRGNWHRVFIRSVDAMQRTADVLLVDWGCEVVVPWANFRQLNERFAKSECHAIQVKLAHVMPSSGVVWPEEASVFLRKHFITQTPLTLIVYNETPLEVALFDTSGPVGYSINAQLVQEKLAISTGMFSKLVDWPDPESLLKQDFSEKESLVSTLIKKAHEDLANEDVDEEPDDPTYANHKKRQIQIVRVESPDLIYIKFTHLEQQEVKLERELHIHYQNERTMKEEWSINEVCVVQLQDCYVRGRIIEKVTNPDGYRVYLYDNGTDIVLPKEKIYVQSAYFQQYPNIVFKCYLANIRPAGGTNWSLSSIDALERTFDKCQTIYASKLEGEVRDKAIPMLMWYLHTKIGGALEPTITKFVSINQLLVRLGFAYNEKMLTEIEAGGESTSTTETMNNTSLGSEEIKSTDTSKNKATKHDSTTESINLDELTDEKEHKPEEKEQKQEEKDQNREEEGEQKQGFSKEEKGPESPYHTKEMEISDWKPPFPIKKRAFNAWITCADPEGILYLREEQFQDVYKNMETNLKQYFESKPQTVSTQNHEWEPGHLCTISYNDGWYRGKVLKVNNPTEIVAMMIDFGSDHILSPQQLHREILYPEIPAFAARVQFNSVYSKTGSWLDSDYDTLLEIITEYAKIVIKGPLDVEIPAAEVYDEQGRNVNNRLVKLCPNLSRTPVEEDEDSDEDLAVIEDEEEMVVSIEEIVPSKEIIPKEEEIVLKEKITPSKDQKTSLNFKIQPFPEASFENKAPMQIANVISYNKIVLKDVEEDLEALIALNIDIQENCEAQPKVETVKIGVPCICPYAEDGLFYRAVVHEIQGLEYGYVFVLFVDFGNIESVEVNQVKAMKDEWFELPVSCYVAEIGIELKDETHRSHVLQNIKKLFGKTKLVHCISKEPLVVELFEQSGEPCYKTLIDSGLVNVK